MSTSRFTALFKPTGANKISRGILAYVCERARLRAYNLLVAEFKASGISQADLGRRLDKAPEVISRLLSRPSNLELDTLSAAIFAMNGGAVTFGVGALSQGALRTHPLPQTRTSAAFVQPPNQLPADTSDERIFAAAA